MQPMIREERTVIDLMVEGTLDSTVLEYYEQTTFTNAAAETAEGATKPEGALAWTLRTAPRDIAWWIPMTKQALRTTPSSRRPCAAELVFGIRRREETQVLTGDGIAPNLLGILNLSGIQTQAKGADPTPDAVYKAMQKVRGSAGSASRSPPARCSTRTTGPTSSCCAPRTASTSGATRARTARTASGACPSARPRR
jgi:hypothetical protein